MSPTLIHLQGTSLPDDTSLGSTFRFTLGVGTLSSRNVKVLLHSVSPIRVSFRYRPRWI